MPSPPKSIGSGHAHSPTPRSTTRPGLARLRSCGEIGELLANQSERYGEAAREHDALPNDLLNFHWDPVAAGVALDWNCITMRPTTLRAIDRDDAVQFVADGDTGSGRVSVAVDAAAFEEGWLECIEAAARRAPR